MISRRRGKAPVREVDVLDEAGIDSHASKIRDDGFTVIEHAASPELVEALKQALLRTERDHHLGYAKTSFEGFKTVRINNLLTYDDLFWEVPLHENVLPVVDACSTGNACCPRSARWCSAPARKRSRSTKTRS